MKVYIIIEGQYDSLIRGVTLSPETASKICKSFSHLGLYVKEHETIEDETLRDFLSVTLK